MSELHTSPPVGEDSRRRRLTLLAGLMIGVLALTATACATNGKSTADPKASQGLSNVDASSTPDTGGGGTDGTGGGGTGGNGDGGTSTSPSTKPSTKTSTPAGPRIEVFAAVGIASCPSGGPNFSSPGGVTLTWKVTGATMVGLSIDDNTPFKQSGHGSWRDYPVVYTTASDDVPFACSDPTGTKTHKYFLDAIANGVHVTKTLTLSAYWAGSA